MTDDRWLTAQLDDKVNRGCLEDVQQLLEQGADVNGRNTLGDTPLMAAAYTGQANMVRLLLEFGADAAAQNREGKTAKELAVQLDHQEVLSAFTDIASGGMR